METIGDRIREARHKVKMTLAEVAEGVGVTPSAVSQWEKDRTSIDLVRAMALAKLFDISLQWLVQGDAPSDASQVGRDPKHYAPIVTRVQAGLWGDVISPQNLPDDAKYIELTSKPIGFSLALEIDGESMLPEFHPGDIIIIDTGLEPLPGDYVVAIIDNDTKSTFKKYRPRGLDEDGNPIIELTPLNPDYPTLTINTNNPGRIAGTMIEHRRFRRRR